MKVIIICSKYEGLFQPVNISTQSADVLISNCYFNGCFSYENGGSAYVDACSLRCSNCYVQKSCAKSYGGIFFFKADNITENYINGCSAENCQSEEGILLYQKFGNVNYMYTNLSNSEGVSGYDEEYSSNGILLKYSCFSKMVCDNYICTVEQYNKDDFINNVIYTNFIDCESKKSSVWPILASYDSNANFTRLIFARNKTPDSFLVGQVKAGFAYLSYSYFEKNTCKNITSSGVKEENRLTRSFEIDIGKKRIESIICPMGSNPVKISLQGIITCANVLTLCAMEL